MQAFGDRRKKETSTTRIARLHQGTKTITDYFIEIDKLNLYAQLDPEAFPYLLKANLKPELRKAMAGHKPKPTNYADWRELALQIGGEQEAEGPGIKVAASRPPTSSTKP